MRISDLGFAMSTSEGSNGPPSLAGDGTGYEEWKKLLKMWAKFTKYPKNQQASVVTVKSLKGEARSIALSMEDAEIEYWVFEQHSTLSASAAWISKPKGMYMVQICKTVPWSAKSNTY